jgi:hypothetical protein
VLGFGVAVIATEADAWKEVALSPVTVAVSVIFFPVATELSVWTLASNSSDWPVGRLPILQTLPRADGQTVKRGALTCARRPTTAVTDTALAGATVLQTQIA